MKPVNSKLGGRILILSAGIAITIEKGTIWDESSTIDPIFFLPIHKIIKIRLLFLRGSKVKLKFIQKSLVLPIKQVEWI